MISLFASDGDIEIAHRCDSIRAKTGRYIIACGSLAVAREQAPALLAYLVAATLVSKLPPVPEDLKGKSVAIGKWAAKIISTKPLAAQPVPVAVNKAQSSRREDSRRPRLGTRAVALGQSGSTVIPVTSAKTPRQNPIAGAAVRNASKGSKNRNRRRERETLLGASDSNTTASPCHDSFNAGFGMSGSVTWSGRSKQPRRSSRTRKPRRAPASLSSSSSSSSSAASTNETNADEKRPSLIERVQEFLGRTSIDRKFSHRSAR